MKRISTLRGDTLWHVLGIACCLVAASYAIRGDWVGLVVPMAAAVLFFHIPRLLDSEFVVGWTAGANKVDDMVANTAIWDAEEQKLVPLVPNTIRMQWYVDLIDARPSRRQYERQVLDMIRELGQMKDPSAEQIAELYKKYH